MQDDGNISGVCVCAMLAGIIADGFQKLKACTTEQEVQEAWFELLTALQKELLPCFHVHDTSTKGYLNAPVAKIDFTCTANGQVSKPSCVDLSRQLPHSIQSSC